MYKILNNIIIPLDINKSLPRMTLRKYSKQQFNDLPHIIMTQDREWDPNIMDINACFNKESYDNMNNHISSMMILFNVFMHCIPPIYLYFSST